jgi:hypothetical protein
MENNNEKWWDDTMDPEIVRLVEITCNGGVIELPNGGKIYVHPPEEVKPTKGKKK